MLLIASLIFNATRILKIARLIHVVEAIVALLAIRKQGRLMTHHVILLRTFLVQPVVVLNTG